MKNFYISDTHFGHQNILRFDNRPFSSISDMENKIVHNWNNTVGRDDTVYILGDFCWCKKQEWIRILGRLVGHKVLILGNHDIRNMPAELRNMFADVKDYKEITDRGRHVIMSHYPMMFYKAAYSPDCYMLCGHVHTTNENDLLVEWTKRLRDAKASGGVSFGNIINVGAMMPYINYTPRTLDEILPGWEEYINGQ